MKNKTYRTDPFHMLPSIIPVVIGIYFANKYLILLALANLATRIKYNISTRIVINGDRVEGNAGWGKHSYDIKDIENIVVYGVLSRNIGISVKGKELPYVYAGMEGSNEIVQELEKQIKNREIVA